LLLVIERSDAGGTGWKNEVLLRGVLLRTTENLTARTATPPWPALRDGGVAGGRLGSLRCVFLERVENGLRMAGHFHRPP